MEIFDIKNPVPTIYGDHIEKFAEIWNGQIEQLRAKFMTAIEEVRMQPDYPTDVPIIYVTRESLISVLDFMRKDAAFSYDFLADITATDESPAERRFEIVYQLFSGVRKNRIRIKCRVREDEAVPTAVVLWSAANWAEREIWDMFGIKFTDHPDLRRILMDDRWVGHPLRKDYPLRGYQAFTTPIPVNEKLLEDDNNHG